MDDLVTHHGSLKQFLQSERPESDMKRSASSSARVHKAREKLLKLSRLQFAELSTDVYDELQRRLGITYEPSDFLAPKANFHPKRNQARQKLSTLPSSRFRDLASDIQYEIERRHEEIGVAAHDIGRPEDPRELGHPFGHDQHGYATDGHNGGYTSEGLYVSHDPHNHIGADNMGHAMGHDNHMAQAEPEYDPAHDTSFEVTNQPHAYGQPDGHPPGSAHGSESFAAALDSVPHINVSDEHSRQLEPDTDGQDYDAGFGHDRAPSQQSQNSFPESGTLQSKTLIPNKSTLVEETDSEEEDSEEDHEEGELDRVPQMAQSQPPLHSSHTRNMSQMSQGSQGSHHSQASHISHGSHHSSTVNHFGSSYHPATIHPEDMDTSQVIESPERSPSSPPMRSMSRSVEKGGLPGGPGASSNSTALQSELVELKNKLADSENLKTSLMEENDQLHEFMKSMEADKAKLVETCNAQLDELEEEKGQLREIIEARDFEMEDLRGRHEALVDRQTSSDDSHASLTTRISSLEAELELKEEEVEHLKFEFSQSKELHMSTERALTREKENVRAAEEKASASAAAGGFAGLAGGAVAGGVASRALDFDRLPSISPDSSMDRSMPPVDHMDQEAVVQLQTQLREQREKTSEVKKQASLFLSEMKSLAAKSHDNEALQKKVHQLEVEIQEWKSRYSKTKAQVRSLRSSVYGNGIMQPAIETTNPFVDETHGLVEDVSLTKFQLAMDEYLLKSRGSEHSQLLHYLHQVIVATRQVTQDVKEETGGAGADYRRPLLANLSSVVSKTANQLITCSKNHATSAGLLPIYLLDASAANLACAVIELVKVAKIRSAEGERKALTREHLGLSLKESKDISSTSPSSAFPHSFSASSPTSGLSDGLVPPHSYSQTRSGSVSSATYSESTVDGDGAASPIRTPLKGNSRLRTLRLVSAPSSLKERQKQYQKTNGLKSNQSSQGNSPTSVAHNSNMDASRQETMVADLDVPKMRVPGPDLSPREVEDVSKFSGKVQEQNILHFNNAAVAGAAAVGAAMAGTGGTSALSKSNGGFDNGVDSPFNDSRSVQPTQPLQRSVDQHDTFHLQESIDPLSTFELPNAPYETASQSQTPETGSTPSTDQPRSFSKPVRHSATKSFVQSGASSNRSSNSSRQIEQPATNNKFEQSVLNAVGLGHEEEHDHDIADSCDVSHVSQMSSELPEASYEDDTQTTDISSSTPPVDKSMLGHVHGLPNEQDFHTKQATAVYQDNEDYDELLGGDSTVPSSAIATSFDHAHIDHEHPSAGFTGQDLSSHDFSGHGPYESQDTPQTHSATSVQSPEQSRPRQSLTSEITEQSERDEMELNQEKILQEHGLGNSFKSVEPLGRSADSHSRSVEPLHPTHGQSESVTPLSFGASHGASTAPLSRSTASTTPLSGSTVPAIPTAVPVSKGKFQGQLDDSEEEETDSEEEDDSEDDDEEEEESEEEVDEQVIAADLGIQLPKAVKFDGEDPDNTVEDLQYYLEEQCVGVIEAIQNLLTAIKGNSNMIAISAHSRAICKVVLCMVDATSQSMDQTRNHLLKESGTWICQDLRACTDRMKMIFKDDKFVKPGAEYPPKQFKQRLAGLSFDLTKCTKELVKTVEEVSLQTEIGEIDRQIAHN